MYDMTWGAPAPAKSSSTRLRQRLAEVDRRLRSPRLGAGERARLQRERSQLVARMRAAHGRAGGGQGFAEQSATARAKTKQKARAKARRRAKARAKAQAKANLMKAAGPSTSPMQEAAQKAQAGAIRKARRKARRERKRARARARLRLKAQAQAQASGGAVTVPAGAAAGVPGKAPRRVRKWAIQTLPVARTLRRKGMRPAIAAQQAAASVGVPSNVRAAVVSKVLGILLRTGRRRAIPPRRRGLRAFIPSPLTTTTATSTVIPVATPVGPRPPGAIPNWMIPSGVFSPYPSSSMMSAAAPAASAEDDDLDLDDEDLLEEEIPFYKRPLVLVGAAVVGYFAYQKYGKKGKAKRRPKAGKKS